MRIDRVLLVYSKSLYQIYVKEHHERAVRQALKRKDSIALTLRQSHAAQAEALSSAQRTLRQFGIEATCRWRAHMRSSRRYDLVISLGGDGTLLDTSHRILDGTPLLGINSDPGRSVGALCSGTVTELPALLEALASRRLRPQRVSRLRVRVDGREVLGPTLNDVLFSHSCPAGLTRFDMAIVPAERALSHRSGFRSAAFFHCRGSGIWVSTATGSTAAIHSAGGKIMPTSSRRLQYVIREPYSISEDYPSASVCGMVPRAQALILVSRLRRAEIWADGPYRSQILSYSQHVVLDQHPSDLFLVRRTARHA
jgi:NAD+ kinase